MRYRNLLRYKDQAEAVEADRASGFTIVRSKIAPVVFAFQTLADRVWLKAYRGKAINASGNYSFRDLAKAEAYAAEFAATEARGIARSAARRAERAEALAAVKASDFWAVGDVGTYSWGYDQTNTEFWQVVEVKAKTILIRRLQANKGYDQWEAGTTQPRRNEFRDDKVLTKRVGVNGSVGMDFGGLYKWDGKASYWSAYA